MNYIGVEDSWEGYSNILLTDVVFNTPEVQEKLKDVIKSGRIVGPYKGATIHVFTQNVGALAVILDVLVGKTAVVTQN